MEEKRRLNLKIDDDVHKKAKAVSAVLNIQLKRYLESILSDYISKAKTEIGKH